MSVVINGMEMPINCTHCPCSDDQTRFCNAAKKYIPMLGKPKFCPLATIEERKKGMWLFPYGDKKYKRCSVCERDYYSIPHNSNFCPNCGADMRGEGHE